MVLFYKPRKCLVFFFALFWNINFLEVVILLLLNIIIISVLLELFIIASLAGVLVELFAKLLFKLLLLLRL